MGWFGGSGRLSLEDARRIWYARQGLGFRGTWTGPECLTGTGWLRTLGGNAYLSCRARMEGFQRSLLEDPVFARGEIESVPSVRSCVMLVPGDDIALSLAAARPGVQKDVARVAGRCDVVVDEIEDLANAAVRALSEGPMTSEQLRTALPADAIRSLGEVGRKLGDPSTLSLALRLATASGRVRRLPHQGRLDQNRVLYAAAQAWPDGEALSGEGSEQEVARRLIERFLRWAAPARVVECARWTGLGKKVIKALLPELDAREIPVDGHRYYALPGDGFLEKKPKIGTSIAFLPADDNLAGLRESVRVVLPDRIKDAEVAGKAIAEERNLRYHQIFDEGALIGLWEYDPDRERLAWGCFGKVPKSHLRQIETEATAVHAFVRDELGDLKMASIDSKKARDARIVAIDELAS